MFENISEASFRVCAEIIKNMIELSISKVVVCNIVQKLAEKIKQYIK